MALKHEMIANDLAEKIKHQQFCPGDFLPSEKQLSELYGASRETTRKSPQPFDRIRFDPKIKRQRVISARHSKVHLSDLRDH